MKGTTFDRNAQAIEYGLGRHPRGYYELPDPLILKPRAVLLQRAVRRRDLVGRLVVVAAALGLVTPWVVGLVTIVRWFVR